MKSILLGAFIAHLACCSAHAEVKGYFFGPTDADTGHFSTKYKFHVEGIKGYVTSAELFVSPAARPIWNNYFDVSGSESTSPILGESLTSHRYIGKRYVPRELLFNSFWGLDVTDFMREVTSPYVEISASSVLFTEYAQLRVTTFIPEPSSFALFAIGVGGAFAGRRCRRCPSKS